MLLPAPTSGMASCLDWNFRCAGMPCLGGHIIRVCLSFRLEIEKTFPLLSASFVFGINA